jgi:hypothetical protein
LESRIATKVSTDTIVQFDFRRLPPIVWRKEHFMKISNGDAYQRLSLEDPGGDRASDRQADHACRLRAISTPASITTSIVLRSPV